MAKSSTTVMTDQGPAATVLVACIDREIGFREKSYPRWVKQGKLTAGEADRQLYLMRAVRARLLAGESWRRKLAELGVTI